MAGPNWDDLRRSQAQGAPESPDTKRFNELSAQLFAMGAGKEWLDLLRKSTIERRSRRGASEAELRDDEARRGLVHDIENARDRGRDLPSRTKPDGA